MQENFEQSFKRLEDILKQLSSGNAELDASLKLYEEADKLIKNCNSKLKSAEQKIEMMVEKREGDVELQDFK